jgi:hypothetical protein
VSVVGRVLPDPLHVLGLGLLILGGLALRGWLGRWRLAGRESGREEKSGGELEEAAHWYELVAVFRLLFFSLKGNHISQKQNDERSYYRVSAMTPPQVKCEICQQDDIQQQPSLPYGHFFDAEHRTPYTACMD